MDIVELKGNPGKINVLGEIKRPEYKLSDILNDKFEMRKFEWLNKRWDMDQPTYDSLRSLFSIIPKGDLRKQILLESEAL